MMNISEQPRCSFSITGTVKMNISEQPRCSFSITRTVNDEYFRAATLIVTDDPVPRDIFYNGRLKNERGAVVLRLAPSWFRYPAKISRSGVRFLFILELKSLAQLKSVSPVRVSNEYHRYEKKEDLTSYETFFLRDGTQCSISFL